MYRGKGIRNLGIAQMVIGVLMGIFGIANIASVFHWSSFIACGLWVGVWVFLTGLFGYLGAKSDRTPNNCLIGTMMGFAVTGCVLTAIMVIISSFAVGELAEVLRCSRHPTYSLYNDCHYARYKNHLSYSRAEAGVALSTILLLLAIAEFFIALASSIYGCNACCCSAPPAHFQTAQQVAYIGPQQAGNVVVIPAGGYYAGSTIQTVTAYPGQAVPVMQMQGAQVHVGSDL
ncbi:hypothetical protein QZH41_010003 [Actinostola sp. cb2023]|nr:hypothetical protein QZH41_010003 [Actinostola sp. cb2023]